jgi:transposase
MRSVERSLCGSNARAPPAVCITMDGAYRRECSSLHSRRGIDGLSALVQTQLSADVLSGQLFIFRGRRGDRVKILWADADGLCLLYKRLNRGKFTWTHAADGAVLLTGAQLSALLEGIDWRRGHRSVPTEEAPSPTVVA